MNSLRKVWLLDTWVLEFLLEPRNGAPHVNGILTSTASLKEDELLASEAWCIIALTPITLSQDKHKNHRIAPVS
jgi:hypothetical protein